MTVLRTTQARQLFVCGVAGEETFACYMVGRCRYGSSRPFLVGVNHTIVFI